jgi:hypothetical protein
MELAGPESPTVENRIVEKQHGNWHCWDNQVVGWINERAKEIDEIKG